MSQYQKLVQRVTDEIATKIRGLRLEQGISNNELSQRSGLSRASIRRIEEQERNPTISTLLTICAALKVPCWKVIKESEEALGGAPKVMEDSIDLPEGAEKLFLSLREKCRTEPEYALMLMKVLDLKHVKKKARTPDGQQIDVVEVPLVKRSSKSVHPKKRGRYGR